MNRALLQMHLAVLLWGFTGVLGLAIQLDAPVLVWWRMLLTALIMAAILQYRKEWIPVEKKDKIRLAVIGSLIGLHWIAFYGAIKFSTASIALVCLSTASVFTAILDPLVNKSRWAASEIALGMLALAGVYLIYHYEFSFGKGIAFGVIAALLSSVFTVLNKKIARKYPPRVMVFYEMTAGWIWVSVFIAVLLAGGLEHYLIAKPENHTKLQLAPAAADWKYLLLLSLCCTVWAQSLALSALKKLSSFTVTLSVNLEPVYGIILAFIFYHEDKLISKGFYLGVGLIILSVGLQMARLLKPSSGVKERGGLEP